MPATAKSVCVFCGSRSGTHPAYARDAQATGAMLARNGWGLVYGAGDVGLMGLVAKATQSHGGRTFGVIPVHLVAREVGKRDLDSYVITETMHERKKVMFMNADAIVLLPGGAGSLDEFFEVLTLAPTQPPRQADHPSEHRKLLGAPHDSHGPHRDPRLCRRLYSRFHPHRG